MEKKEKKEMQNKKNAKWPLVVGIAVAVIGLTVALVIGYSSNSYQVTTYSMGSYVQQTLYGSGKEDAAQSAANAVAVLEDLISWRVEDSDIQKLNAAAGGEFVELESTTYQLLLLASDVYETSGGAFDITIAPVSQLWDFDSEKNVVPDTQLIEKLLANVDGSAIKLSDDNMAALYSSDNAVELGAIGKGAACDAAVASYESTGISAGIISVGGSVGVYGSKLFGKAWSIAVRDPEGSGGMGTLSIKTGFVSTSGSYEKGFEQEGVWYHHILDPETGYPAESGLISVTVWTASSGALSDALATACFVVGLEDSLELLEIYDAEAVFITEENEVLVTDGLRDQFELGSEDYHMGEI